MSSEIINVAIMEDHQSIIDGYLYRLDHSPNIHIVGKARFGVELYPLLEANPTDILLMDVEMPTSPEDKTIYPTPDVIPVLKEKYPRMSILVISGHTQQVLVERLFELGVRGYIFKNDSQAIEHLAEILESVQGGSVYFSQGAYEKLRSLKSDASTPLLSPRQLEALSLCVAFPDSSTKELSTRLGVSHSTFRNLLSTAYTRLDVRTRQSAIAQLQKQGIAGSEFNLETVLRMPEDSFSGK